MCVDLEQVRVIVHRGRVLPALGAVAFLLAAAFAMAQEKPKLGANLVPSAVAQDSALKELREIFKEQFADAKSDSDKLTLAQKLRRISEDSEDNPAVKFVSLQEARRLVAETGDLAGAFALIDSQALEFEIDVFRTRAATLKAAAPKLKDPAVNRDVVERSLQVVEQLQAKDQYQDAVALATVAVLAAAKIKDKALTANVQSVRRDAEDLAKEFAAAEKAYVALQSGAADPAAKLAWGKWLCLQKEDWDAGLKLLQLASDPKLKELASRDLERPTDSSKIVELGTDWLDYAKSGKGRGQARFANRAVYWLSRGLEGATGLAKTKLESQIEQAYGTMNRSSPLMALVAIVSKKVLVKEHTPLPMVTAAQKEFQELPSEGAVLVGLKCRVGKFGQYTVITAIQSVYATKKGLKLGEWRGKVDGQVVDLIAREGYAVSNVGMGVGSYVDSIQVEFARVTRTGLDLADTYSSKRYGGEREIGRYIRAKPHGPEPIIGLYGVADDYWTSLGAVTAK